MMSIVGILAGKSQTEPDFIGGEVICVLISIEVRLNSMTLTTS